MNYKKIDKVLYNVSKQIKLLAHLRPLNLQVEKRKVFSRKNYNPFFVYRRVKFNPAKLKDKLNCLCIDDSNIGVLFDKKRNELLKEIGLVESIGKVDFTDKSISLYGKPRNMLVFKAKEKVKSRELMFRPKIKISCEYIKKIIERRLMDYELDWSVKIKKNLASALTVSKEKNVFIKSETSFSPIRLLLGLRHEIDCHVLRAENGKNQPYSLFNRGFANYLETEEGLATLMEESLGVFHTRLVIPPLKTIAVDMALYSSFAEIFDFLQFLGFSKEYAWNLTSRVKRGLIDTAEAGGFTKDYVYFSGYWKVKDFLDDGGKVRDLFYGKFSIDDLKYVRNMKGLVAPKHLPLGINEKYVVDEYNLLKNKD